MKKRDYFIIFAVLAFGALVVFLNRKRILRREGEEAVYEILETHADIIGAMSREGLGEIDFKWGKTGDPSRKFKGGSGFAKIVAKHGIKSAYKIPEIIVYGKLLSPDGTNNNRVIVLGEWRVVLTKTKGRDKNHWVLSAYLPEEENKEADEKKTGE